MNTNDDLEPRPDKRQAAESDIGPEPDWLALADGGESPADPEPQPIREAVTRPVPIDPVAPAIPVANAPAVRREHPWLWALIPLVFVGVVALVAWFSSWQTLNGTTVWQALRTNDIPLLPARWSMLAWWLVLALLALVLIHAITPAGRAIHRIRLLGPLVIMAMTGATTWMIAELWAWDSVAFGNIAVSTIAVATAYLSAHAGGTAARPWHKTLRVTALGATLAYACMLLAITWHQVGGSPLGDRGTSVVVIVIGVALASIFALFLKDGSFAVITAVWFLGVAQRQWGDDTALSLAAIIGVIFCVIAAGMGVILATESKSTTIPGERQSRNRITFFRRNQKPAPQELP